jgi:hypothetical protein
MSARKILGAALLALPNTALAIHGVISMGWLATLMVHVVVVAIAAALLLGCHLVMGGDR